MSGTGGTAPLRVIQVGAGGMGQVWLDLLASSPDVELVGLVDLNLELASSALRDRSLGQVAVGSSITELLETLTADAVIDVTVPVAHHAVNTEAMGAGIPVLCEKPIAPTVALALSLAATSEVTKTLLMTSQSRRYYRSISEFRRLVGTLGDVGVVTADFFLAPRFGGFRDEMDYPLLVDMAIHTFDAARFVLGTEPVSVYCESFNPAWSWYAGDAAAMAIFEFDGGVRFAYNGSWCSPGDETSWNAHWRASGATGTATWDGEEGTAVAYDETEGDTAAAASEAAGGASGAPGGPQDDSPEVIAGALAEFVAAIRTGSTPSGEVHSNVLSLAMVEAAVQSAELGARVRIDEVLESAYATAIADERDPAVRAALVGWGSAARGLAAGR